MQKNGLVLVDLIEISTKTGSTMRKAKLADPKTYDSIEVVLSRECSVAAYVDGGIYDAIFDVRQKGFDFSVNVTLNPATTKNQATGFPNEK